MPAIVLVKMKRSLISIIHSLNALIKDSIMTIVQITTRAELIWAWNAKAVFVCALLAFIGPRYRLDAVWHTFFL